MRLLGIIPARYGSTRLPGKPMIKVGGKTIIQRVYERVSGSSMIDGLVVATDDVRIYNHVKKFGGNAIMTRQDHRSGTMRCGEVIESVQKAHYVVNVQGDEPLINPREIDRLCAFLMESRDRNIATLVKRIERVEELEDPSVAKVVIDNSDKVLYFSRSAIPFVRNYPREEWLEQMDYYKHIGLYAYSARTLRELSSLPPSDIERAELLEQLNWLYNGHDVYALETEVESIGVDTPEDLSLLEHIIGLADE